MNYLPGPWDANVDDSNDSQDEYDASYDDEGVWKDFAVQRSHCCRFNLLWYDWFVYVEGCVFNLACYVERYVVHCWFFKNASETQKQVIIEGEKQELIDFSISTVPETNLLTVTKVNFNAYVKIFIQQLICLKVNNAKTGFALYKNQCWISEDNYCNYLFSYAKV